MLSRRWAYVYSFERKQFSHWVKSVVLHWTNKNRLNDTCERREEGQSGIRRQTKVFDLILFGFYSEPFEHVPFHYMHNASIRLSWAAAVGEREWTASSVVDGILSVQDKIECVACWNVNRISPAHRSLNFSSNFSNIVFSWNERLKAFSVCIYFQWESQSTGTDEFTAILECIEWLKPNRVYITCTQCVTWFIGDLQNWSINSPNLDHRQKCFSYNASYDKFLPFYVFCARLARLLWQSTIIFFIFVALIGLVLWWAAIYLAHSR